MKTYQTTRMSDCLTRFDDHITSTCYILEGSERNLMIDTGTGDPKEFQEIIAPFMDKPLILVVTHAHADHYANAGLAGCFQSAYMHPNDIALLPFFNDFFSMAMADEGRTLYQNQLTPTHEGDIIDLGNMHAEIIGLPGHSPGSICVYIPEINIMFTGDAVGSGGEFWMQLPYCLPIAEYIPHLHQFISEFPSPSVRLLGGHSCQAGIEGTASYNPVTYQTLLHLEDVSQRLIDQDPSLHTEPRDGPPYGDNVRIVTDGTLQMVYRIDRIR